MVVNPVPAARIGVTPTATDRVGETAPENNSSVAPDTVVPTLAWVTVPDPAVHKPNVTAATLDAWLPDTAQPAAERTTAMRAYPV